MTAKTALSTFPIRSENDLEDYLEADPSLIGQDLLIIGRQVRIVGGIIDLLAIDSTGVILIVELKLGQASPAIIAQVLRYRRPIKRLDREMLSRLVADGDLGIDLAQTFQRHFGCPLPERVNESQQIIIVAAAVHPKAAGGILALLDDGYSITTFRYVVQSDALSLIPCCRSERDVAEGSHLATRPLPPPNRIVVPPTGSGNYPVDETVRRFWSTHAQDFAPLVTFSFIFDSYERWVHAQPAGVPLHQRGLFGRHLSAITAKSNDWTRVFVSRHRDMAAYNAVTTPPDAQPHHGGDYTVVAYERHPIGPASEL